MTARIGLLGDVMLGRGVAEALAAGADPAELFSPGVRSVCRECDAVVCNLECCVSARGAPTELIPDKPFFFRAPPEAVESLGAIGAGAASLANNHALDFGPEALIDTLAHLEAAGIATAGAGSDRAAAQRGAVIEAGGLTLGLLAFSDHPREFAAAPGRPGIAFAPLTGTGGGAPRLPGWIADELGRLRQRADAVLAFPHWGPNMTRAPARWQRELAALLGSAGADLVAGHSAHVFHGAGWGERAPLLYDLGGAIDDYAVDPRLRNDLGLLALWRPGEDPGSALELVGLALDYCYTQLAAGADAEWVWTRLRSACAELGTAVERLGEARFAVAPADPPWYFS